MRAQTRRTGRDALALVAAVLLLTLMTPALAGGWAAHADSVTAEAAHAPATPVSENPRVLPVNARPYGASYGEWGAQWWTWATAQPFATSPLFDQSGEFCDLGQSGGVWFLAGILGGGTAVRDCAVPAGKALFFPVANGLSFAPEFGDTEDEIRADVANDLTGIDVSSLGVMVDGSALEDLAAFRAASPAFVFPIPEGSLLNEFGFDAGDRSPAVSDGWWIMLAPLSRGEHTIQIQAAGADGFELDVTYNLTIGR